MIKVGIIGANGKMGTAISDALEGIKNIKITKKIDIKDSIDSIDSSNTDVVIDFTVFDVSKKYIPKIVKKGIDVIIGTSGWSSHKTDLINLEKIVKQKKVSVLIAPNFSIGAVLEKIFAVQAAKYFNSIEIVEMHHNEKKDAPSGTAVDTAQAVSKVMKNKSKDKTETKNNARGANINGINIHSVRQPGLLAHQIISFGGNGERLIISHDSFSRQSFVKGVIFAIENIKNNKGLKIGLENYI